MDVTFFCVVPGADAVPEKVSAFPCLHAGTERPRMIDIKKTKAQINLTSKNKTYKVTL
jgi:hypothetical protein